MRYHANHIFQHKSKPFVTFDFCQACGPHGPPTTRPLQMLREGDAGLRLSFWRAPTDNDLGGAELFVGEAMKTVLTIVDDSQVGDGSTAVWQIRIGQNQTKSPHLLFEKKLKESFCKNTILPSAHAPGVIRGPMAVGWSGQADHGSQADRVAPGVPAGKLSPPRFHLPSFPPPFVAWATASHAKGRAKGGNPPVVFQSESI